MFKNREKFNKFLSISTPILFGMNLGLILIKILGILVTEGDYAFRMFAFSTMYNPPGFMFYIHNTFCGLILTLNTAYCVLSFVALSLIKDDQKHRTLALTFAIISFVMLSVLASLGMSIDTNLVGYWVVPLWFIVLAYHITFSLIFFFKFLNIKKSENQ